VVPAENPVSPALSNWLVVPEPIAWEDVLAKDESAGSVPHSNQASVARPLGVTLPFRVAVLNPTDVAAAVVATGGDPSEEVVKNWMEELFEVPFEFDAQVRK
jgi:hypothetical protein